MPIEKAPAYQWYPKDYENDEAVKLMTYEQEGIYRRLLDHQALHGGIPSDIVDIAMLVPKVTLKRFLALWPRIAGKFEEQGERLVNMKLERVKANTAAFKAGKEAAGRASAAARAQQKGNRPSTEHSTEVQPATATASSTALASALKATTTTRDGRGLPPLNMNLTRLKIWRWMIEDFIVKLGDHADAFDIEAWIQHQDATERRVVTGEWGAYWFTAFEAEVRRRGLPLAGATPVATLSKRSNGLLAAVANLSDAR